MPRDVPEWATDGYLALAQVYVAVEKLRQDAASERPSSPEGRLRRDAEVRAYAVVRDMLTDAPFHVDAVEAMREA